MTNQFLQQTLEQLDELPKTAFHKKAFIGLDGFIDSIQKAVKLQGENGPLYFESLEEFGMHISKAAGKSAQIELQTQEIKLGGSAPIMAESLGSLGFSAVCIGSFGAKSVDKVFQSISKNAKLISIGGAGKTNALEFFDGKLILSDASVFNDLDWRYVKDSVDMDLLVKSIANASLIALVDWCNLPHATSIWKGILGEVMPKTNSKLKSFFFDIADPARRTDEELVAACDVAGGFKKYGNVTLGLNENETEQLFKALSRANGSQDAGDISLVDMGIFIFGNTEVTNLVIHPTKLSISIDKYGVTEVPGRFVAHPKISTGGGDNFNAGYCAGQLSGFDIPSSLTLGMATSGYYVENGKSGSLKDIKDYIFNWIAEPK